MLGQLLDGRYQITKVLGAGGFGRTYVAEDTKLYHSLCVVKQLKPMATDPMTLQVARRLFESEAQLLHKLGTHDQIPQLLAHFEENEEFFLVQQFIDGHPLSDELTPGKRLSEPYTIALLQNILQTLAFVHQNQVIHRDIKPPNLIRRNSDGKIVLIDFGAVKQISTQVVTRQGVTKMTVGIGTPGYMPSEQSRGIPKLSSDIYGVGIIGIQSLTGLMPQELEEDEQTAEIKWRDLVQVSPPLADILDKMIRYDFRQRYKSAVEALAAVQQLGNAYAPTQPSTHPRKPINSDPPLYSPPPKVPAQYRQEIPQKSAPAAVSAESPNVGIGLYFQWVLANVLGSIGGLVLVLIGCWGLTIGFMQLLVLRRHIPISKYWWLLGTTLGTFIPYAVALIIFVDTDTAVGFSAMFGGVIVGIIQWWLMRPFVKRAYWWIVVNSVPFFFLFGGIFSGIVLVYLLKNPKNAS
ncbi:protein kinase [Nodularia spumigena CS-584]|uniref:non-specific serine/threonine protein kinase n=1 Tax=Nodularia spumigena UHCC 0039 TaxID=1914872 RepID=A0A2S0Q733_NODSP|nr:protein kinase [Nodularia spumigena]AHJ28025.1 serine/threonine kinase [Nodularia spumigena CCY9414]AVZ30152.1 serine/threonine-protein kinase C [Nodularia spumigena UHCC 0039]EAW44295.1 serine/threonine kinase [Nodularia spumigena CCY9414]MDB9382448.1 protein kinase [Nodularia spumigena CS-584]